MGKVTEFPGKHLKREREEGGHHGHEFAMWFDHIGVTVDSSGKINIVDMDKGSEVEVTRKQMVETLEYLFDDVFHSSG